MHMLCSPDEARLRTNGAGTSVDAATWQALHVELAFWYGFPLCETPLFLFMVCALPVFCTVPSSNWTGLLRLALLSPVMKRTCGTLTYPYGAQLVTSAPA